MSKVMEIIINQKLMKYLESNMLINDKQYGFRSKRSTGDLLTYLTLKLISVLHKGREAVSVSLDISKAFDRVWHTALLSKCRSIGLDNKRNKLLIWIENFLSNRSIKVLVDGFFSELYSIAAGVPQGSVLSPILFIIFINDLLSLTSNPIHSYADDSTLVSSYNFRKKALATTQATALRRTETSASVNSDLIKIAEWGMQNRVDFNASKTHCCIISRKQDITFNPQINFQGLDRSVL